MAKNSPKLYCQRLENFQNGWDNCFCSFCNEICFHTNGYDIIKNVIEDAALTNEEINNIITYQPLSDKSKNIIIEILNK